MQILKQKKKKLKLFVGKCTRQFLNDVDGYTVGLELHCLDFAIGLPVILQERLAHLGNDVGFFPTWNIIAGPLQSKYLRGTKWEILEYPNLVKTYNIVKILNREETHKSIYNNCLFRTNITLLKLPYAVDVLSAIFCWELKSLRNAFMFVPQEAVLQGISLIQ